MKERVYTCSISSSISNQMQKCEHEGDKIVDVSGSQMKFFSTILKISRFFCRSKTTVTNDMDWQQNPKELLSVYSQTAHTATETSFANRPKKLNKKILRLSAKVHDGHWPVVMLNYGLDANEIWQQQRRKHRQPKQNNECSQHHTALWSTLIQRRRH